MKKTARKVIVIFLILLMLVISVLSLAV